MSLSLQDLQAARRQIVKALWFRGDLSYQLHDTQKKIQLAYDATLGRQFYLLCSRRLGKSHFLVTKAIETCLQKPNARVLYLAPHAKLANEISGDIAAKILNDCPEELKPAYHGQAKEFHFHNGSVIRIKGVNGEHAQYLRGGAADLVILDECGIMDDLKHVLSDVVAPMTMTTGGKVVLATTPPRSPAHESAEVYERLAGIGAAVKFTLRDSPHVADETKIDYLIEAGETKERALLCIKGTEEPEGTTARREYFCHFVTDANTAVVPEFTEEAAKKIVRDYKAPDFYDCYVSMDPGFEDRTGVVFGYWDFLNGKLVIQDEILLHRANTADIAEAVKAKELALWGDRKPLVRVSDVDLRLIADLYQMHGLQFSPARKEDSLGAINLLRHDVATGTLVMDPRCENLKRQLKNATWNKKATDFERGGEIEGHFDLLAALKYLCRSIQRTKNPYPAHYYARGGKFGVSQNAWVSPKNAVKKSLGLLADTPVGRRLAGLRKKRG